MEGLCSPPKTIEEYLENGEFRKTNVIYIIVPGNPGVSSVYEGFAKMLNGDVIILGLCGHHFRHESLLPNQHPPYTLNQQIAYVEEKLENILSLSLSSSSEMDNKQYPPYQFIILSHSIGSYICLHSLDRILLKKSEFCCMIQGIGFLMPAIAKMRESIQGQRIFFKIIQYDFVRNLVCFAIHIFRYLPSFATFYIREIMLDYDNHSSNRNSESHSPEEEEDQSSSSSSSSSSILLIDVNDFDKFLNYSLFNNVFYMFKFEYQQVNILDEEILKRLLLSSQSFLKDKKVLFLFAENDHWVPDDVAKQTYEIFSHDHHHIKIVSKFLAKHAFPMYKLDSLKVVNVIEDTLL